MSVILGRPQHQHTNQVMFNISQARTDPCCPVLPQPRSRPVNFPHHHLTALSNPDQKKTGSSSRGFQGSSDRNLGLSCGCGGLSQFSILDFNSNLNLLRADMTNNDMSCELWLKVSLKYCLDIVTSPHDC